MDLYNCYSDLEKKMKYIDLQLLSNQELLTLANDTHQMYLQTLELQDENIVLDIMLQIVQEQARRLPA